tara:strand:- start:341 stop:526 length:186 start_codon:yes stop_codon:yes gene_type:complete
MKSMSARDAKNGFGRLIDLARLEPVTIEKHGRAVAVVMSVERYDELALNAQQNDKNIKSKI